MLRRLRPLLFWLLIATLPLKGLATVVWAGCEPMADAPHAHHVVKTTTDTGVHPQQHPHADRHHHGNPSAHAPVSLELFGGLAELNLSAPAGASADTDETSSHCHHGAPCCTLVAPAPALFGLNLPLAPTRHGVALATAPADVVMDVPHRPPRHPLV
jgi:hypothetical protein